MRATSYDRFGPLRRVTLLRCVCHGGENGAAIRFLSRRTLCELRLEG